MAFINFRGACIAGAAVLLSRFAQLAEGSLTRESLKAPLKTPWTDKVDSLDVPWPEYPRPQMVRRDWLNLNGQWDYMGGKSLVNPADAPNTPPAFSYDSEKIKVPFPPESYLSGVMRDLEINMWYQRNFTIPSAWAHNKVILHFGAIAETASIYVNGKFAGHHVGRWETIDLDVTKLLHPGSNTVIVGANDPHDGRSSCGKGALEVGDYVFTSGIWQTVWLEPVPNSHVQQLNILPNIDDSTVTIRIKSTGPVHKVRVTAYANGHKISSRASRCGKRFVLPVHRPRLWSPDDPFLYDLRVELLDRRDKTIDQVESYFGMRSISLGKAAGKLRTILNGHYIFQYGPLDQGYWPDGIHTAPTDEAFRYDLQVVKDLGFNMVRKHAKVEPQRWYYWADKIGLLVWQDMPSLWYPDTPEIRSQFEYEWKVIILQLFSSPSIVTWVPFNENWGAYDVPRITDWTKSFDPNRLVDGNSGYNYYPPYRPPPGDPGNGDFDDHHQYPGPGDVPLPSETRAASLGEFGGTGLLVEGHMWPGDHNAYEMQPSTTALTGRFVELNKALQPFIRDKGLGVAVYTQVSDVEHEVNGILTYDRKVRKMDFARVKEAVLDVINQDIS